jgi:hypothetical protein
MKKLLRIGGIAPFVTISFYLTQFAIIALAMERYPVTTVEWFTMFNRSNFLGLVYLNALDGFSIAVLGLLYIGLWAAFKGDQPAHAHIALYLAVIGVSIFVATRGIMVTGTLSLSQQYAAVTTAEARSQLLAAGAAVMNITRATPETFGFLFLAFSGALFSALFLVHDHFKNWLGYLGFAALGLTALNDLSLAFYPSAAPVLMILNGLSWFTWWIATGLTLRKVEL